MHWFGTCCALMIYYFLKGLKCENIYIFQCMNSYNNIQLQISSTSSATIIKTSRRVNQNWSESTMNSLGILSSLTLTIPAVTCSNVSSPVDRNVIMVNTTAPVSIVAIVEQGTHIQTMKLLRLDGLGKYYYVASWKPKHGYSYVGITPLKDDTTVIFSLPNNTSATVDNQTYNDDQFIYYRSLMSYKSLNIYSRDDLTGGYIVTSQKVAVISGTTINPPHSSADSHNNSVTEGTLEYPVMQMITPMGSWGKTYICFPFQSKKTAIKIIAGYADTTVTIESISTGNNTNVTLRNGQFITRAVKALTLVTSSFPVMVVAYLLPGARFDNTIPSSVVTLTPVEQWMRFQSFSIPKQNLYSHYINIMCKTEAIESFILDFEPLSGIWISGNNYSATSIRLSEGFHHIYNTITSSTFSLFVYGHSEIESSYGYTVQMHLARLYDYCENSTSEADDGHDNDCDGAVDEEFINGLDDDEDGLVDEDCFESFIPKALTAQTVQPNTVASHSAIDYKRELSVVLVSMFMAPIICGLLGALLMVVLNKMHSGAKVASNQEDDESCNQSTRHPGRSTVRKHKSNRVEVVDLQDV
ncbi:hypothetical protein LOTGIDRAFT_153825 [Lottia gigantea]|uniref:IgGFc-binding protein N-terminal domain-containing protein n=1 Tax=Lottia gigantea TaxID=225164 RepID=V4A3Z5_LOTGI|nr:hypothetical protein LOTGIDRAFT_153825 [Lottia gigantea]ESO91387.1 hypothetical protein LOTGIDRAFT_153825 [Lottia gigantea]